MRGGGGGDRQTETDRDRDRERARGEKKEGNMVLNVHINCTAYYGRE